MREVHITELHDWNRCKYKHQLKYFNSFQRKDRTFGKFWFGIQVHTVLANYYRAKQQGKTFDMMLAWSELIQQQTKNLNQQPSTIIDSMAESVLLGESMLKGYEVFANENDVNWEIISVEKPFKVVVGEVEIVGTIDLLIRDKITGKLWIVDHKTYARFLTPETIMYEQQFMGYSWLVEQVLGERVAGVIANQLLKKIPAEPALVANGTRLSKDKSIVTSVEKYRQAIIENGFDIADYYDILEKIETTYKFYHREPVAFTPLTLKMFATNLFYQLDDMTKTIVAYPNRTWECTRDCGYVELCNCYMTGGNVDQLAREIYDVEPIHFGSVLEDE